MNSKKAARVERAVVKNGVKIALTSLRRPWSYKANCACVLCIRERRERLNRPVSPEAYRGTRSGALKL